MSKLTKWLSQSELTSLYSHPSIIYLSFYRFSLAVDDSVLGNNAVRCRVCLHHLELHSPHATTHQEQVTFVDGTISFQEVWLEEHLNKKVIIFRFHVIGTIKTTCTFSQPPVINNQCVYTVVCCI